ncbi:hypothetical protein GCM10018790_34930 [Kitasatospora xanthocidica]|nr:hypothetical protein GCM10018790_34930 [Kitasatospora xanthocidica]
MIGYISEPERLPVAAAKVDEGADKVSQSDTGFGESAAAAIRHGDWTIGSSLGACASHGSAPAPTWRTSSPAPASRSI